jgi:putative chitinase
MISIEQLRAIMPRAKYAAGYLPHLIRWMRWYGITTPERARHFLAQLAHESSQLNHMVENLNYSADGLLKTFKRYFTPEQAAEYAYKPERIASRVYASRMGNGPESSGDGWRYRGRGAIMITGKDNYAALSKDWNLDAVKNPELLEDPSNAIRSACWFWWRAGLNRKVDAGATVKQITRIVNGGYNGLAEREAYYETACKEV